MPRKIYSTISDLAAVVVDGCQVKVSFNLTGTFPMLMRDFHLDAYDLDQVVGEQATAYLKPENGDEVAIAVIEDEHIVATALHEGQITLTIETKGYLS